MNPYLKPLSILLVLTIFTNCKKEATLSEYKYADKDFTINCNGINPELLKEAVYAFEDDITKNYAKNGKSNLSQAYSRAVNLGIYGRGKYQDMVSPHTIEIFNILKTNTELWNVNGDTKTLNYNSEFVKCLADNLTDKDLKTTFNALLTTNSMSPKLFGGAIRTSARLALKDKYLATYIALDMYYAKLFDIDFNQINEKDQTIKLDPKTDNKVDPHAGHDH